MPKTPISRAALEQNVWQGQDRAATPDQQDEIRHLAFGFTRVYCSKVHLRAEAFLRQN